MMTASGGAAQPPLALAISGKDLEEEIRARVLRDQVSSRSAGSAGKGSDALAVQLSSGRRPGRTTAELLDKRSEADAVDSTLAEQKRTLEERRRRLAVQERAAETKAAAVKAAQETFDRFREENDERLRKAEEKLAEETQEREQKERDVVRLRRELEDLTDLKAKTSGSLETLVRYQRFLAGVVDHSDEFADARGIIDRWRTLKTSSAMLEESIARRTAEIETRKAELQRFSEEKTKEVLGLDNRIAALQVELQEMAAAVAEEEKRLERMLGAAVERTATAAQITMACQNLLARVDKAGFSSRVRDPIQQLEVVCGYILDVKDIVDQQPAVTTFAPVAPQASGIITTTVPITSVTTTRK
jgi:DNA repair exonuclease SbcCD ATPase subunit